MARKKYCAEYLLKELQEGMDRCTGCCDITEILLKAALKTPRNQSTNFKAKADDKLCVAEIMGFVFERAGNIVGKGENAGYRHFLLFLQCFH